MDTSATRGMEYSAERALYLAFELGNKKWKLGFSTGLGQAPRIREMPAGDLGALQEEIHLAKKRFGLPEETKTLSCYEAGRDGFWLARYLAQAGIENLVVDSSSIEVNRRRRRVKTDRMDATKLVTMLIRYHGGDRKVWHVVRVPSVEAEDGRQPHRELGSLKRERTRHINWIKGLLAGQGIQIGIGKEFARDLDKVRLWDGSALGPGLRARLVREFERIELLRQQVRELEWEQREALRHSTRPEMAKVRNLVRLKGIGITSAWLYTMELFSWREIRNRRELGALAGLTPTPHQSGDDSRELGISKAGNNHVRAIAIELAWAWLRHQPDSKLALWYQERFAHGGSRVRRIGIVAVARRLLIDLWRYSETGVIPEGAVLRTRVV